MLPARLAMSRTFPCGSHMAAPPVRACLASPVAQVLPLRSGNGVGIGSPEGPVGFPGTGRGWGLGPMRTPPRRLHVLLPLLLLTARLRVWSWRPPIPPTASPGGSQRQPPAGSVLPSQAAAVGRAPTGPAVGRAPIRGTPGPELRASLPCMSSATCTFHSRRAPEGPGLVERPQLEGLAALRVLQAAGPWARR